MIKRGDTVWAARFNWNGEIDVGSAIVKSASDKQIMISGSGSAFRFASRYDPSWIGKCLFLSPREALEALLAKTEAEIAEATRRAALARAALDRVRP